MTSTHKRCIAIKQDGLQCTRSAKPNSDYCWQHEPININISNEISNLNISDPQLAEILQYAGEYTTTNKFAQTIINNENKKLQEWLQRIGVRTQWKNIPTYVYEDLWKLYTSCNGGYPDQEYKYDKQLSDIFFSKEYSIPMDEALKNLVHPPIDVLRANPNATDFIEAVDVNIIDRYVKTHMDTSVLREGDTIWLQKDEYERYRNDDVVMWDGSKVLFLNIEIDDYGACNEKFDISTFPLVSYFQHTIDHNSYVWLRNNVKINEVIELDEVHKIIRNDGIVIYTINDNFIDFYNTNTYIWFTYLLEDFIDSGEFEDNPNSTPWAIDYENERKTNPRILFHIERN